jgi:hypothetical protein
VQAKYLLSYKPIPKLYILVLSTKIGKDQTWNIHKILTKKRTKSLILCKMIEVATHTLFERVWQILRGGTNRPQ